MKILFICGSLEQGRDGVGDYTRRLAIELLQEGHGAVAVSLNEKTLDKYVVETQQLGERELIVYRIPKPLSESKRFSLAKNCIDTFNPDWISLQYVPYSFNGKGLPFGLAGSLGNLAPGKPWHIMFHELWIGISKVSPVKHRFIGFVQRKIAKQIIHKCKPQLVTTSNKLYQILLQRSGFNAAILPLFSNIPVAARDEMFIDEVVEKLGIIKAQLNQWILLGIFGHLYPEATLEKILADQLHQATTRKKGLAFVAFGRMNTEGIAEFKRLQCTFEGRIKFLHLGEQSSENISNLFQILNAGISCTPAQHIGKSGVFAAMKLHGLQVILPVGEVLPEYETEIKPYREELQNKPADTWSVEYISHQFTKLLNEYNL